MQKPLQLTWDLESIFAGGSQSEAFKTYLNKLINDINDLPHQLEQLKLKPIHSKESSFIQVIDFMQNMMRRMKEADSYIGCLAAQNSNDKHAVALNGKIKVMYADIESALTRLDELIIKVNDQDWKSLLADEKLQAIAFPLNERRDMAMEKCSPEKEALIQDLSVDGYHGWAETYNTIVGRIEIPFQEQRLSAGQMANKLSHSKREVREQAFDQWEKTWSEQADLCADALNHIGGFRLQIYKHRKWDSVHKEPLDYNRMSEKTLHTMWKVIDRNKPIFLEYLQRKAKLLGLESLSWHDVEAPVGSADKEYSYNEAAEIIVKQFRAFSPQMADFAVMAFEKNWIEAEDRAGKRPGGFCTSLPDSGQTRIFMTYAGTASNVATLAHELGHAYHQHVMNDLPDLAQNYAMNVAETASTFAEMIVSDATVKNAGTKEEKLSLLEDKIQRSVAFYMNIHARFIFESRFYEARKDGLVSVEKLNELMVNAQKVAFNDSLSSYHPHFWASKLHFYLTDVPFYNFPYTFGYLLSSGIYAKAIQDGDRFEEKYIKLLRDTGSMTVEQLAMKHLDEDLTQPEFWQSAIDLTVHDVNEFLRMTE